MKYDNRSKAVHDALRRFISDVKWMKEEKIFVIGAVLALYYINKPGLIEEISRIQHKYKKVIQSIQQIFIEENKKLKLLSDKEINYALKPENYLGATEKIIDRVIKKIER